MRRLIIYFFGGLACLGAGATFYIAVGNITAVSRVLPDGSSSRTALVAGGNSTALIGTAGSLGSDDSTASPRDDKGATIFFGGDMMLGRSVAVQMGKNGNEYPFANIKETVSSADYAIANLEGPITKVNNSPTNRMVFHFDPALAPVLEAAGFDALSLANNHGLDQGAKGAADTKKNLSAADIGYFGEVSSDKGPILNFETGGQKFAVFGLHDVYRKIDPAVVAKEIETAKKDDAFVIVYPHWGVEYDHEHNARQAELAHAFIDAGADLVVGSHPHVVQGIEVYKGKTIFYSLGNLIFDQYFSVETQEGLALRLNIKADGKMTVDLLPYEIPKSQPSFVEGDKKSKMLQDLASWSDPALKDLITVGNITP